ncbi:complex I NDUFA9 subunit family protein [Frigidibacter sp. MR17.14]|uniref:complex I NDUFA9 subunit family protein n=1 Tax=Frigidibacter sp. MR17.14 TaxID=3126509 RepID=UPI0030130CFB
MSKLVTIFGGSGFVGRYVARRMAKAGWRVRVACRRPNEALFVRPYGAVGQVEPILCNIRSEASVAAALAGADAVVNCVGILAEAGKNRFDAIQAEGAARVARLAKAAGVQRLVQISAIGADAGSASAYGRSKAAGEAAVAEAFPGAVILRPSIIFGPEDQFFNRFASMSRFGPVLPLVGAETKFQPVFVEDVAAAAAQAVLTGVPGGVYELGGPEVMTFRQMMQLMLKTINRRRLIVDMPRPVAGLMAGVLDGVQAVTGGLLANGTLTRDQLKNLGHDNTVSAGARGFEVFGIVPATAGSILPSYLWRFRPSGQYDAIKASAKNLRA